MGVSGRRGTCTTTAAAAEADKGGNSGREEEECSGASTRAPSSRPPARLLDQRLQIRDTLLEIAILLGLAPTVRCSDGHRWLGAVAQVWPLSVLLKIRGPAPV